MAENTFTLRLVSGRGVEAECEVQSATAPSPLGQLGFLPYHCDFVGLLGTGIVEYQRQQGAAPVKVVVSEGIVTFRQNVLTLLVDSLDTVQSIQSIERAAHEQERNILEEQRITTDASSSDWTEIVRKLERLSAIDELMSSGR